MTAPIPRPELLAPAGSLHMMRTAFDFGADAIYAGQPRYSLRVRNNSFNRLEALAEGIGEAHRRGRKFYLVSNIYPHNAKIKNFIANMEPVVALQPDALIMADPGLMMLVRERWPEMPLHLSVQANTTNYASVRFWQSMGIRRIILSRELSLDEVEEIRNACPDIELEVFIHGALCIAYSGRCLLSGYFNHRDANQGSCTNSCRWNYAVREAQENAAGDAVSSSCEDELRDSTLGLGSRHPQGAKTWLLEEAGRPGELMPVEEDAHGTYIMNSRDLRAVEHVERLARMGIHSLKIEGRTKSAYYVARTTQVYRRAIDDAVAGRAFDPRAITELEGLANRGYTDGFYQRHHAQDYQNYLRGHSQSGRSILVGEVVGFDARRGMAEVEVKNALGVGDRLEYVHPGDPVSATLEHMEDAEGVAVQRVPGAGRRVWIRLPDENIRPEGPCFLVRYL